MKKQIFNIIVWRENKLFVAKFLELELTSQGKTKQEAVDNLKEALELYLEAENTSKFNFPSIKEVTTQIFSFN